MKRMLLNIFCKVHFLSNKHEISKFVVNFVSLTITVDYSTEMISFSFYAFSFLLSGLFLMATLILDVFDDF